MRIERVLLRSSFALALLACGPDSSFEFASSDEPASPAAPAEDTAADAASPDADAGTPPAQVEPAPDAPSCEQRIAERALEAPSARHRAYARRLPEVLVHARVDPVLFLRWPAADARPADAASTRARLERSRRPARDLGRLLDREDRALLRGALLTDGYLFAEQPSLARALSSQVRLQDLFDAPRLYRVRDGRLEVLERVEDGEDGEGYVDADGRTASLRLNDRVSESEAELAEPLGVELELVREQTGALRTVPTGLSSHAAALDLTFPDGTRRPSLVELREGRTEVVCVGGEMSSLPGTLAHAARFWERHARLTSAARALVAERARFDEPINEPDGVQEDGVLRRAWAHAYARGERVYTHREIDYPVFDASGRPVPPQVCVDFIFDAWERGGGSWYRPAGEAPGRTVGELDFDVAPELPRRSIAGLLSYASAEGGVVERADVPRNERVALRQGAAYARAVARAAELFREGDALIVHGLREQDMRLHYHALLVIRTEPMTGVPMVVADNQGRPHFRSLAGAMRAAPLRSINHRLRVDHDALWAASPDA